MATISPKELQAAARVADGLVYAAGLAGVVAGGLLLRDQQVAWAVVAWALTFTAGAGLRLAAFACRALARLLQRQDELADDIRRLGAQPDAASPEAGGTPDPYRRWGDGWHGHQGR